MYVMHGFVEGRCKWVRRVKKNLTKRHYRVAGNLITTCVIV